MISGKVTQALDAVLSLRIQFASGSFIEIAAVVDTGFNGTLAISKQLAEQLGVVPSGSNEATLADGRIVTLNAAKSPSSGANRRVKSPLGLSIRAACSAWNCCWAHN